MDTATNDRPVHRPGDHAGTDRFRGKYLALTSFKRDGTGVTTPVWFVVDDGQLLVLTASQSFKVKRIHRNPAVTVAACTASGRLRGEPVPAHAQLLPTSELPRVEQLLNRKYRRDRILILPIYRAVQRLRGVRGDPSDAAVAITPDPRP
jgi:uncharacterized protein